MIPSLLRDLVRNRTAPARAAFPVGDKNPGGLARPLHRPDAVRGRLHRPRRKSANARQLQLPLH
jgi:hypothetical protein